MHPLRVVGVRVELPANQPVVLLREEGGARYLPIWIGAVEASASAFQQQGVQTVRPLTHDLCKRLITGMGAVLHRVQITKVQDNTYFAELHLLRGEDMFQIDARPSDSIAIALRFSAPIFAQESLLTAIEVEDADVGGSGDDTDDDEAPLIPEEPRDVSAESLKEYLEKMRPEDFGKFNL